MAILCAGGDPGAQIVEGLTRTQHFIQIDVFDTSTVSPSMATLGNFHTVLVCNHGVLPHNNADDLGDILADYVETGGGVVFAQGSFASPTAIG
ncbi:MAG: hypothetical protein GWP91_00740 [Rhodobacterales bacterium]|nr:hypothetical protein [Rhodobacterales bacterium]